MIEALRNVNVARLESLIELAQILGQQNDFEEVLRLVVEKASSLVNSDATLIMMINPKTRNTIKTIYAEKNRDDEQNNFVHTNISGWVILNNSSLLIIDSERNYLKKQKQSLPFVSHLE